MKKYFNWIIIISTILCVLVADLVTKHFLFSVEYYNLIPGVISVATNGGNTGAAWGMFSGKTLMLIIVSVLMIIAFSGICLYTVPELEQIFSRCFS